MWTTVGKLRLREVSYQGRVEAPTAAMEASVATSAKARVFQESTESPLGRGDDGETRIYPFRGISKSFD
jgi:hypothetical protein